MNMKLGLVFLTLIWAVECVEDLQSEPVVKTEYGKVKGTIRYAIGSDRPVYSYFGVQYGRSPEYVFRFRPAEDPWAWDEVRDVTNEERPLCIQDEERLQSLRTDTYLKYLIPDNPRMSENCLVVDVFSPLSPNKTKESRTLLPVIAWIHGGSFQAFFSTTKLWALPAYEDVVLVQIQYRVGLFGFLTTDDAWAPPNSALQDHLKALRWIKKNIAAFGGDPDQVTLMGESAGGVAVTANMFSSLSKGLFHRVFAMSGVPNWMVWKKEQNENTKRIAKEVNCYFENNAYTSTCLRNKINSSRLLQVAKDLKIIFTLGEGDEFMPESPETLIESKSFTNSVPIMIGVASGEADYLLPRRDFADIYNKGLKVKRDEVEQVCRELLREHFPGSDLDAMMAALVKEYMNRDEVGDQGIKLFNGMIDAIADCGYVSKAARFAEKLKESNQSVHFYQFTHKPAMYDARPKLFPRPYDRQRADHADDMLFFFGLPFIPGLADGKNPSLYFTEEEKELSRKVMKMLAHFAKTGSPPAKMKWPQYPGYAVIDGDITISGEQFQPDRMDLWNEILPSLAYGV